MPPEAGPSGPARAARPDRFLAFAFAAAELLVETDRDGRILFAEGAFPARFGRAARDFLGRPVAALVAAADRAGFRTALEMLPGTGRLHPTGLRLADPAGTAFVASGLCLAADEGSICFAFAPIPQLLPQPPPGGPGLARLAEDRLRSGEAAGSLSFLDIATPEGAFTPRPDLAERIRILLAEALPDGVAAELGGGRFGLLADAAGPDLAALAAGIARLLEERGLVPVIGTMSLDLASPRLRSVQATRALRFALSAFARGGDAALRQAGFDGGLAGFAASAAERAGRLRAALAERRFRLAFQPIVALADRAPHHYEALLRPMDDAGTAEFVALAETVGLSEELDWAVVGAACEAASRAHGARIACNLSGLSLQNPAFRARLLAKLDAAPDLALRLLFEITETAEIEDETEAAATVIALRDRALPVCLDDFGAGAAAFRYLRAFPVDFVKVDGAYVANAPQSERDRGFIAAMVDLARTVGAGVIAERVETEEEAALMLSLGVGFGQGFLFGRPGALPGH